MIASDVVDERNADYRPMGRAFVGVGGVFLATGVVFVIVDQTVLKKRRARRTSIGHLRLPRGGGITIKGRF